MNKQEIVENFILKYNNGLNYIFNHSDNDSSSFDLFLNKIKSDIIENCKINSDLSEDDISSYLFYYINDKFKNKEHSTNNDKIYACPGCLFFGVSTHAHAYKYFKCPECTKNINIVQDEKYKNLYKIFSHHALTGYKCAKCFRFIPKTMSNVHKISCPYLDCCFVGDTPTLKAMRHPTIKSNTNVYCGSNQNINISSKDLLNNNPKFQILLNIIHEQSNRIAYSNFNFTLKHKLLVYKAFENLLNKFPDQMIDYLCNHSRNGGFQNKIFQEYIQLLEESLPFIIKKNNKVITIDNLLHDSLRIFDGMSTFNSTLNKGIIKNNTQEYYIGGRKSSYIRPFYIGKLLNIIRNDTGESIINKVSNYTFSKIKIDDIGSNVPVTVTHLRAYPHYQMGGMVYVNRIRKQIVDEFKSNSNI